MELKDLPAWVSAGATVVAAIGLILTALQIRLVKRQGVTQFEDNLAREYRELAGRLPSRALLGEPLTDEEHQAALDEFIHYIDLSNEQIFLRRCRRISAATWEYWRDGIRSHLEQPAFARAWRETKERSCNFRELRRLEAEEFRTDPAEWTEARPNKSLQQPAAAFSVFGGS